MRKRQENAVLLGFLKTPGSFNSPRLHQLDFDAAHPPGGRPVSLLDVHTGLLESARPAPYASQRSHVHSGKVRATDAFPVPIRI